MATLAVARYKRLATGTALSVANTVVYTAPAAPTDGSAAASFIFTVCNKTAGAVTLNVAKDNGSTLLGYIVNAYAIAANDTFVMDVLKHLMGGERIQLWASAGTSLDYDIDGMEVTNS